MKLPMNHKYALFACVLSFGAAKAHAECCNEQDEASQSQTPIASFTNEELLVANKAFIKNNFDMGNTNAGNAFFTELACHTTIDTGVLSDRQNVIKALIAEPALLERLSDKLKHIFIAEMKIRENAALDATPEQRQEAVLKLLFQTYELEVLLKSSPVVHAAFKKAIPYVSDLDDERPFIERTLKSPQHAARFYGALDVFAKAAGELSLSLLLHQKDGTPVPTPTPYCFAEFVENSDGAVIEATNMWKRPNQITGKITPQSISLGTDVQHPQSIIATIKSRLESCDNFLLYALPYNLILAQTLGIARAESFRFTPFTQIIARVPIMETPGLTAFKSTVNSASKLIRYLDDATATDRVFIVTDLFSFADDNARNTIATRIAQRATKPNVVYVHVLDFANDGLPFAA